MKKLIKKKFFWFFLSCLGLVYLAFPFAALPDLPDSLKSDEPGDTVEMVGVSAFYTDLDRYQLLDFYRRHYSAGLLPLIILNHPPEYGRQAIRETTESTFLYELVQPFRGSLFLNGFDPAEHPELKKAKDPAKIIEKNGRFYQRKLTLRQVEPSFWQRSLVFLLAVAAAFLLWSSFKKIIVSFKKICFSK